MDGIWLKNNINNVNQHLAGNWWSFLLVFYSYYVSQSRDEPQASTRVCGVSVSELDVVQPFTYLSRLYGSYLRRHSAVITCLFKLCQLCLRLSLPAMTFKRSVTELNLDRACHYQDNLRLKLFQLASIPNNDIQYIEGAWPNVQVWIISYLRCFHQSTTTRRFHSQERTTSVKSGGIKNLSFLSPLPVLAMPWKSWWKACGQSHVSLYSLWVVPWGAVWLFWDNLLITIQYGPLEKERESHWNYVGLFCECEWSDFMSKSRPPLCLTLKSRRFFHLFD